MEPFGEEIQICPYQQKNGSLLVFPLKFSITDEINQCYKTWSFVLRSFLNLFLQETFDIDDTLGDAE